MKRLIDIINQILVMFIIAVVLCSCADDVVSIPYRSYPSPTPIAGPKGDKGDAGTNGSNGVNGSNGTNGTNGIDATPTTIVKLCGTCAATYPSVFPEVGLCLGGKLYGVYSTNGGFLVELTLGSYSSNGINCSCSFVVHANCVITP